MNELYPYNDELYHHGVKGMKWGVLRSRTAVLYDKHPGHKAESKNSSSNNSYEGEVYRAKSAYKQAKKEYKQADKDLNKKIDAGIKDSYRHPISQFVTKKGKERSAKLANEMYESAKIRNSKHEAMKSAKQEYKAAKKAIRAKKSKSGGSDSTKAKISRSSTKSKFNQWAEKQARKNVRRTLAFQKKHKVGAYGKVSKTYHKAKGHNI